jgi:hypothetical protein
MWKTVLLAILLSLAGSPALASEATSDVSAATAGLSAGATALDEAPVGIRRLTERVVELEQRVDQLGVADRPPAPTAAELKRAKLEQEQHEEFLNKVWSAP